MFLKNSLLIKTVLSCINDIKNSSNFKWGLQLIHENIVFTVTFIPKEKMFDFIQITNYNTITNFIQKQLSCTIKLLIKRVTVLF